MNCPVVCSLAFHVYNDEGKIVANDTEGREVAGKIFQSLINKRIGVPEKDKFSYPAHERTEKLPLKIL